MPDYKKLYVDLFNDVTDEIGMHIQRLQELQQKSIEAFAQESISINMAPSAKAKKKKPGTPPGE